MLTESSIVTPLWCSLRVVQSVRAVQSMCGAVYAWRKSIHGAGLYSLSPASYSLYVSVLDRLPL